MAAITGSNSYTLRVELTDFDDKVYLADYRYLIRLLLFFIFILFVIANLLYFCF